MNAGSRFPGRPNRETGTGVSLAMKKPVLDIRWMAFIPLVTGIATQQAGCSQPASTGEPARLVLVAGKDSHGSGAHEFARGMNLFAEYLAPVEGLEVTVVTDGWPGDESVFERADAIVFYSDGLPWHPLRPNDRLEKIDRLVRGGASIGMMHFALDVEPDWAGDAFKYWIGGHYETHFSANPFWTPEFESLPEHPVTRGIVPFSLRDEWYFNMRFREGMSGIIPILVAKPSDQTRDGPYVNPRGPYPHIQADKGRSEILMWLVEREDGGRGFGFTGGHFHQPWVEDADLRNLLLNTFLWLAGLEVPQGGMGSQRQWVKAGRKASGAETIFGDGPRRPPPAAPPPRDGYR